MIPRNAGGLPATLFCQFAPWRLRQRLTSLARGVVAMGSRGGGRSGGDSR